MSGHADRDELLDYAVASGAPSVVLCHGDPDARAWFAGALAERMPDSRILDPMPLVPYTV
jgi:Cft2 family RNA processing exonuclease